jgi:hypothetical protein
VGRLAHTIAILSLSLLVVASGSMPVPAEEAPFMRILGKDIRMRVIGKTVTDGAHWSDTFERGGVLISWSQGRKSTGRWEIRGDELCIAEEAGADATCYQVWVARDEISLRLGGVESTFTGYLRNP